MRKHVLGLVLHNHHLLYGMDHGFGQWLPMRVKHVLVLIWNWTACVVLGHSIEIDHRDDPEIPEGWIICTACCRVIHRHPPALSRWQQIREYLKVLYR